MKSHGRALALETMRKAVLEQRYVLTPHALLEMRDDRLDVVDVESAILTGTIERVFDDDPRGRRYEVVGKATDLATDVGIVARFVGPLLIFTVYEKQRRVCMTFDANTARERYESAFWIANRSTIIVESRF